MRPDPRMASTRTLELRIVADRWVRCQVPGSVAIHQACGANNGQAYAVVTISGTSSQLAFRVDSAGGADMLEVLRDSMKSGNPPLPRGVLV